MPIPSRGDAIRDFLCQFFQEDVRQRPEFGLGFEALSRTQMERLSNMVGLKLPPRPANKRKILVPLMNGALANGDFDRLIKIKVDPKDAEIAELRKRLDVLERVSVAPAPKTAKMTKRGPGGERKALIRRAMDLGYGNDAATAKTDALKAFVETREKVTKPTEEAPAETALQ